MSGPKRPASNGSSSACQRKLGKLWPLQVTRYTTKSKEITIDSYLVKTSRRLQPPLHLSLLSCRPPRFNFDSLKSQIYIEADISTSVVQIFRGKAKRNLIILTQEPAPPQYTPSAQQTVTNADFQVTRFVFKELDFQQNFVDSECLLNWTLL